MLHDRVQGVQRALRRRVLERMSGGPAPYDLVEITGDLGGTSTREPWVVFRATVEVRDEVRRDPETARWQRHEVTSRQIAAAFAPDEEGQLRPVTGTAYMGVFSFLPLKEVKSGLAFLIQADFLTGPGRETIRRDALWNRWMARELFRFVSGRVAPALLAHEPWRYVVAELLYPGEGGPDVLAEELLTPLRRYVESQPVLVAADGSLVTRQGAVRIADWTAEWVRAVDIRDIEAVLPGQKVLHLLTRLPQGLWAGQDFAVNSSRWPWEMDELVEARAKAGDVAFFKALYHDLGRFAQSTARKALWYRASLVLTEDGNAVPGSAAYWADQGPAKLGSLRRVHPDLWADAGCADFLQGLGCRVLAPEEVRDREVADLLERVEQEWPNLPGQARIAHTRRIFRAWKQGLVGAGQLRFMTQDCRWAVEAPGRGAFLGSLRARPSHRTARGKGPAADRCR